MCVCVYVYDGGEINERIGTLCVLSQRSTLVGRTSQQAVFSRFPRRLLAALCSRVSVEAVCDVESALLSAKDVLNSADRNDDDDDDG